MNGISSWSIRHPIPTIVLFLALTVAGLAGFMMLRTNNVPDIEIPTVTVTINQPGLSPTEMEVQVTRIVEDAVAGLGNLDHISSSINEGSSTTSVSFVLGTNVDRATNDVRNAVSSIQTRLPASAQEPVIARVEIAGMAMLTFVVDAPSMKPEPLSWFVDNDLSKAILSVRGVSKIERAGGVDRMIRIRLDPKRLMALGVTAGDISQTLAMVNVNQPGGRSVIGDREQTVRTVASAMTVQALADAFVNVASGTQVRLKDLGMVEDSFAEPRQRARFDGREVVAFSVYRSVGSSEVDVAKAVRAKVQDLNRLHANVRIQEVTSSTDFVMASYEAAFEALWLGALLAVGVIWLFLRDIRATLVSSLALPLSLIPTFAVMWAFNVSLNTITLLAISLVVGILVDDAIVEIENIVRQMRRSGKSAYESAIEAADEIGLAVVATTATLVAVFLPVAFMPGVPGKFFSSFAIATCVSVLFSLLVARMLTPLLAAYFVKAGGVETDEPRWLRWYGSVLERVLVYRWTTITAGVLFFAGSIALTALLPTDFINATDRGRSVISVKLAPGSTLEQTDAAVIQITKILKSHPEVASVFASLGTQASSSRPGEVTGSGEVRSAEITVNLVPRKLRISQQAFEKKVAVEFGAVTGVQTQFGADGQSGAKISVTLTSDDAAALSTAIGGLQRDMRGIAGFSSPILKTDIARPELIVVPDTARMADRGITAAAVAQTINVATLGDADQYLPKFNLPGRRVSILVSLDDGSRKDLDLIANLPVSTLAGPVPLISVADLKFGAGPNSIDRFDRQRSSTVEAALEGLTLGQATAKVAALPQMRNLPAGVTQSTSGDTERMQELFAGFAMAMGAGILLMYLTLVLLFRGFVQPITILAALPLSIGGALGLLLVCGYTLSLYPLIGLLMLMGIAAKNSILLVDYAITAIGQGMDQTGALRDAAQKRARPIVMTSVAMCAGMMPIALGFGADAESRAPMAVAVIGGLISSTVFSLVYVPVVFSFMDGLERRLGKRLAPLVNSATPSSRHTDSLSA